MDGVAFSDPEANLELTCEVIKGMTPVCHQEEVSIHDASGQPHAKTFELA
jgi:hypothetical protein